MQLQKMLLCRIVEKRMNDLIPFPKEMVMIFIISSLSLGRRRRRKKERY